ncbi:YitT family protein [Paenibacillus chartarius]|uniref:YitT family protein n=1 Tax=Paenibacillus chartarius TaxID=747481 RepID=A0ABV6DIF9_9BACL
MKSALRAITAKSAPALNDAPRQSVRSRNGSVLLIIGRTFVFLFGLAMMAYGIVLLVQAKFGAAPWDVMHLGVVRWTGLSFGRVRQAVGLIVVVVGCLMLLKWPTIGMIANMVLVGEFCNWFTVLHLVPSPTDLTTRILSFAAGMVIWGFGTGVYIQSGLGAGPRDLLMLAIHARTRWPIRWVRSMIEVAAVLIGIALGGPFAIGTIVYSLAIGHITEYGMKLSRFFLRPLTEGKEI